MFSNNTLSFLAASINLFWINCYTSGYKTVIFLSLSFSSIGWKVSLGRKSLPFFLLSHCLSRKITIDSQITKKFRVKDFILSHLFSRNPFSLTLYPFAISPLVVKHFLILCHKTMSKLTLYFPCPTCRISYFFKMSWFLLVRKWYLDTKEVCLLLLTCFSGQNKDISNINIYLL